MQITAQLRPRLTRAWPSLLAVAAASTPLATGCGDSDSTADITQHRKRHETAVRPEASAPAAGRRHEIRRALARVRRHVSVPVVLPTNLPHGTEPAGDPIIDGTSAQLGLKVPGHRSSLTIQYGKAGFDGCGPLNPRAITVHGQPAVINTSGDGDDRSTTLVWPTTLDNLRGRYGLLGTLDHADGLGSPGQAVCPGEVQESPQATRKSRRTRCKSKVRSA